jgi:hypothetical protein
VWFFLLWCYDVFNIFTTVKDSRPWINTEIRKNLRKLQRLYKQKKKTGDQNRKEKYNQLKHHTQKITRQSYWKYIENIVTSKEEEPHSGMKKFCTYIKHKRKDNIGISSLMMDGKLFCDPASKPDILNRQFKSAFSANSKFTKKELIRAVSHRNGLFEIHVVVDIKCCFFLHVA